MKACSKPTHCSLIVYSTLRKYARTVSLTRPTVNLYIRTYVDLPSFICIHFHLYTPTRGWKPNNWTSVIHYSLGVFFNNSLLVLQCWLLIVHNSLFIILDFPNPNIIPFECWLSCFLMGAVVHRIGKIIETFRAAFSKSTTNFKLCLTVSSSPFSEVAKNFDTKFGIWREKVTWRRHVGLLFYFTCFNSSEPASSRVCKSSENVLIQELEHWKHKF